MSIAQNVRAILATLPPGVVLEAAAKTRTADEVREAIDAGVTIIGQNYLQESIPVIEEVGRATAWHYIGAVQGNKVRDIVTHFDMVETVNSAKTAERIDRAAEERGSPLPVLLEVNSAREPQKAGIMPEDVVSVYEEAASCAYLSVRGLMTMGPWSADPEDARPAFSCTKALFEQIRPRAGPGFDTLSMGMSASYRVAVEEGATLVRIGEAIFGPR